MPKIPPKKKVAVDAAKAIKSVTFELIPEATLAETGMAMILAGLGEQKGLSIVDIVEQFPNLVAEAGLPAKLPPWVVRLALCLDRDARDAMLWRYKDRPLNDPRPEKSWSEIKKLSSGELVSKPPVAVDMTKTVTKPVPPLPPAAATFSLFE